MYCYNLEYITFSRIFEKDVSKEIGQKLVISVLPPFLCEGLISENFNQEGKIPEESDLLHVCVCVCVGGGGELVIKRYKLATLPISRIDQKNSKITLKNTFKFNWENPPTPSKACLQH
jgi:hypothetical protein